MIDSAEQLKLFHLCTRGKDNGPIYFSDADYLKSLDITGICSSSLKINVEAYCLMSNHIHWVLAAYDKKDIEKFALRFKKIYSLYLNRQYSLKGFFKRVDNTIKEIDSIPYFKNCIAYVLRNPVESGMVKNADQYLWSSYRFYFSDNFYPEGTRPATSFRKRPLMDLLGTHIDLTSSKLMISKEGNVHPCSFLDIPLVRSVFDNSLENLVKYVMKVDYFTMEYDMLFSGRMRLPDYQVLKIASDIAAEWFKKCLDALDIRERLKLVKVLKSRCGANGAQISRVLSLDRNVVLEIMRR